MTTENDPTPQPERLSWESLGLTLVYHAWGAPDAPLVVILHGFLDHGRSFDTLAAGLADRFRVVVPDHRGHGQSGHVGPGGYYHFPDYVRDLHALLEELSADEVALVGHSMGGSIATYFAGAFPERVVALALLDNIGPPHVPAERAPHAIRRWINDVRIRSQQPENSFADLVEVARRLQRTAPRAPLERLTELAPHSVVETADGRYRWRFDPLHRTHGPIGFNVDRFNAFMDAIDCPVLALWGETTPFKPKDAEARMARIADLTRMVLPASGHNMHLEQPDALLGAVSRFLDERYRLP